MKKALPDMILARHLDMDVEELLDEARGTHMVATLRAGPHGFQANLCRGGDQFDSGCPAANSEGKHQETCLEALDDSPRRALQRVIAQYHLSKDA